LFLYQLYLLIRGTIALNIFIGLFFIYLFWLLIRVFNMTTLESFLGQFIGLGVLALIIVFQQEIRQFLLMIGTRYAQSKHFNKIFSSFSQNEKIEDIVLKQVLSAVESMSNKKIGALIVLTKTSKLPEFVETGLKLNAELSAELLEAIFVKNSPLHDGAAIIFEDKIIAARCILPISNNLKLPSSYGLRHRAAIGVTEQTDTEVIAISEETGKITFVKNANITHNVDLKKLNILFKT